jgi:hypothetical protein
MKKSILTFAAICILLSCSNKTKVKSNDNTKTPEVKVLDSATITQNKLDSIKKHKRQVQERKNRKRKADEAEIKKWNDILLKSQGY